MLTDVSGDAQWVSSNPSVLSVDAGLATAHLAGDTTILARFEGQQTKPMSVLVLPPGTYRFRGTVQNTRAFPLSMARVEVPAVGLWTITDAQGGFVLYGVPPTAEIHISQEGYVSAAFLVRLSDHGQHQIFRLSGADDPFVLTVSASIVAPGGELRVSWTAPGGQSPLDWIGLFRIGDSNLDYIDYQYTNGATTGTQTWRAPTQGGQYEFRYLLDDGYNDVARSSPVTIAGASTASSSAQTTPRRTGRGAAQRTRGR